MSTHAVRSEAPLGVLYVNLGSPAAPTTAAVRVFLDEFLGDPLVVDANPLLWWFVRKVFVLPRRAPKSAALYRRIWSEAGSPLVVNSRRFTGALARELGPGFSVELAMRYGEPSISGGLCALLRRGCARIVLFTAFPQASNASTVTVEREVERVLAELYPAPELVRVPPYFADSGFVAALAARVRALAGGGPMPHVVQSFHGYPVRYVEAGDPYRDHCEATARALASALGLAEGNWTLAYQSRFGREPWLAPDTAEVVPALAARGRVLVTAPSFTTDCLETLEELGLRLRESLPAEHGQELMLVPCLNDQPDWVRAAAALVRAASVS
ncbi:MAG: ferrochelatase [Planctomycetes bacterium]|nr:ferrochelatase [Planctomycetota bacterium]